MWHSNIHIYSRYSVTKSCPTLCDPWIAAYQASLSFTISQSLHNSCPLNQWYCPTISSSVTLFSFCLQSFPASGSFPMSQLFSPGSQSIGVSASASVLPVNIQGWFPLGWTGLISCSPRDSQESFPAPKFKRINSLVLSFLYGQALTTVHGCCKDHSLDDSDLCWQSDVSAFLHIVWLCHNFPTKKQVSFNSMAAVTIFSNFRAQEEEICHCFHCFPMYLPWSHGTGYHILAFLILF